MLFQIASPTFFSGLPNNDHSELGQSKKLSVRVVCSLFQAPREKREGEGEGTKTRGAGERKRGR